VVWLVNLAVATYYVPHNGNHTGSQCCGSENFFSDLDPQKFHSDTDSSDIYFENIPNFSFIGLRTFSEYKTTKKNFVTVQICASFHLTLVFVMLYY
jgi:hypothetical protein